MSDKGTLDLTDHEIAALTFVLLLECIERRLCVNCTAKVIHAFNEGMPYKTMADMHSTVRSKIDSLDTQRH